jgi:N-acyl-D-amino-acid deacylase
MNHDTIIRNGTVVDGTGAPARVADVGIAGDRVVEIVAAADGGISGPPAGPSTRPTAW